MKKDIEKYILVTDEFLGFPIWSLQHPKKEARDGYVFRPETGKCDDDWKNTLNEIFLYFYERYPDAEAYITGTVDYTKINGYRWVAGLKIKEISILFDC